MRRILLCIAAALICAVLVPGLAQAQQKKESLAVFAFTGGSVDEGEALASSLTRQAELKKAFKTTTLITRAKIQTMGFEQRFQWNSGLTDADTIFELGRELTASHVIAGYITRLGNQNLVIVSIMDVQSLQQVAGDYRTYNPDSIGEIDALLSSIAVKLAVGALRDTSKLPGLSVPPFALLSGANQNDAMVLAQILACDLANGTKYAVLPRTDSTEKVLEEHRRQRSGIAETERIKLLGAGRNAKFVLSGTVQRLGPINKFATDIFDIEDGSFIDGYEERYTYLSDGVYKIPVLALQLVGGSVVDPANFVQIKGGPFYMGNTSHYSDSKKHKVTVKSFRMAKYEVTQKEYRLVMGTNPSSFKGDNLPAECVSWYDAIAFCNRLSLLEKATPVYSVGGSTNPADWGIVPRDDSAEWNAAVMNIRADGYRLPTEAEWEYACRAGTTTAYSFGKNIKQSPAYAWYGNSGGNSGDKTHPVGLKLPNRWGLYDMYGNVSEWCWDWYDWHYYKNSPANDPRGPAAGTSRVWRGGNYYWGMFDSATRDRGSPSRRSSMYGFRLVRNAQ